MTALYYAIVLVFSVLSGCNSSQEKALPDEVQDTVFGQKVSDPFRWMETPSPRVDRWVWTQDDYAREHLSKLPIRGKLLARFRELSTAEKTFSPVRRGNRIFYYRQEAKQSKAALYMKSGDKPEKLLIDPNQWLGEQNAILGGWIVDWEGRQIAYTVSPRSDESKTYLEVINVDTGTVSDHIDGAKYALPGWLFQPSWLLGGKGFYYTYLPSDPKIPENLRQGHAEVRFHTIGTPQSQDQVVLAKDNDSSQLVDGSVSRDGDWLIVHKIHYPKTDVFFRRTSEISQPFVPLYKAPGYTTWAFAYKGQFYARTNYQAPKFKFIVGRPKGASVEWKTIIPERKDVVLQTVKLLGNKLLAKVSKDAQSHLEIYSLSGRLEKKVQLPGIGSVGSIESNQTDSRAFFAFESYTSPPSVFELNVQTGATKIWATTIYPALDLSNYVTDQIFFQSTGKTRVPMFFVRRKDIQRNGKTPVYLYGYAAWVDSNEPYFSEGLVPWLEAGGALAVVNARGGGEYGESWHLAGSRLNKQNSFDDMISAAEYLIKNKYTEPAYLAARGDSFGGLLTAGLIAQRPDLFRAVVSGVPVTDMIRYHLFGIGRNWKEEFGTSENEADFRVLIKYSPYHNIRDGVAYPAVLINSAQNDTRVDPMHARKFAARLIQATRFGGKGPILLRTEREAGHGGADTKEGMAQARADVFSFLMNELGMTPR